MDIQFPAGDVPVWVVDALATADIHISTTLSAEDPVSGATGTHLGGLVSEDGAPLKRKLDDADIEVLIL